MVAKVYITFPHTHKVWRDEYWFRPEKIVIEKCVFIWGIWTPSAPLQSDPILYGSGFLFIIKVTPKFSEQFGISHHRVQQSCIQCGFLQFCRTYLPKLANSWWSNCVKCRRMSRIPTYNLMNCSEILVLNLSKNVPHDSSDLSRMFNH